MKRSSWLCHSLTGSSRTCRFCAGNCSWWERPPCSSLRNDPISSCLLLFGQQLTRRLLCRKYEEIYPPEVAEFVYITDDTYTKKQVLRMEHLILKVLAFEIAVPTSHYFLPRFVQLSRSSHSVLHLATVMNCSLFNRCNTYTDNSFLPL